MRFSRRQTRRYDRLPGHIPPGLKTNLFLISIYADYVELKFDLTIDTFFAVLILRHCNHDPNCSGHHAFDDGTHGQSRWLTCIDDGLKVQEGSNISLHVRLYTASTEKDVLTLHFVQFIVYNCFRIIHFNECSECFKFGMAA
jgi:hypothetical protein